jgi:hypothetical protein
MRDDVRKYIYGALTVFIVGVVAWISIVYISACGLSLACKQATPLVDRTPVPTLLPATLPVGAEPMSAESGKCRVAAADLLGAWVSAGSSETDSFSFTDVNGQECQATFDEVRPLFVDTNLWANGAYSCVHCHSADVTTASAQLDLTSYAGIIAGSRRADAASSGTDILGGGNWESSLLFDFLTNAKADVSGHKAAVADGVFVNAGQVVAPTATPQPTSTSTPEPTVTATP